MLDNVTYAPSLAERLREEIKRNGPMTFCDWMKAALYDPDGGYYCRAHQTRWGREGDYRTSPERSSLFAATFARYFASLYDNLDRPEHWTILEVGAGDGRFAHGVLQTLQNSFPNVFGATHYLLDEISPATVSSARRLLDDFSDRVEFKKLEDVDLDGGIVFSNELLDAFPVHRVTMREGRLSEFFVAVDANGNFEWLVDALSTPNLSRYFEAQRIQPGEGQVAEVNLEIEDWLEHVSARMRRGYVITVDYGAQAPELYPLEAHRARYSGTLRGFQRHQMVDDILVHPGEQDITSTVSWTLVQAAGERFGFKTLEFERLDRFLLAAGLLSQMEGEMEACPGEAEKLRLRTAAREMIMPDGMASHFQVLVQKKDLVKGVQTRPGTSGTGFSL